MKRFSILLSMMMLFITMGFSQIAINANGTAPENSAMLDVNSTSKGLLLPRMTQTQIEAITNPANGLTVFNTTDSKFYAYVLVDNEWKEIQFGNGTITPGGAFTCGNAFVDSRDGQSYSTVLIGNQCWMAENLNIGIMINGSSNQSSNNTIEKWCYNNEPDSCDIYGGLYQWDEMMQYVPAAAGTKGICPDGWHLPTDAEWMTLEESLGMCSGTGSGCSGATGWRGTDEGSKLAGNEPLWINGNLDQNANFGTSGFTGLPGGDKYTAGSFDGLSSLTYFWSTTENYSANAWVRSLVNTDAQIYRDFSDKEYGFSVRCVKD